jgi:ABC-2 type transport system permease protein
VIGRTIRSELLKLLTTRTLAWVLIASVLTSAGIAAVVAVGTSEADFQPTDGVRSVLAQGGLAAGIMALLLGIVASGGEYRHGTIAPTLLVTPARGRVVLAQVIVCGLAGFALGAVAAATTALVGLPLLEARGIELRLSAAQLVAIFLGGIAFAGLSAALGSALGSLLANQVLAVGLALLVLFVLEPLLSGVIGGYQRYSLTGVRTAIIGGSPQMAGDPDGGLPAFWLAVMLWIGYTAALTIAAGTVARRREIA